jgi:hypothetical protein
MLLGAGSAQRRRAWPALALLAYAVTATGVVVMALEKRLVPPAQFSARRCAAADWQSWLRCGRLDAWACRGSNKNGAVRGEHAPPK